MNYETTAERNPCAPGQLSTGSRCLVPMMFCVELGGFRRVMGCVVKVTLRRVSMVSRFLMVGSFMVLRRFLMMFGGMFVMLCCFAMVFRCFFGHIAFSFRRFCRPRGAVGPEEPALLWLRGYEGTMNTQAWQGLLL